MVGTELVTVVVKDFQGKDLAIKKERNELWLTTVECGTLLEYKNPRQAINNIVNKHQDEFTNDITRVLDTRTSVGGPQKVREFTLEGFALLCMFSEQPKAVQARRWATRLMKEMWVNGGVGSAQVIQLTTDQIIQIVNDARTKTQLEILQDTYFQSLGQMHQWVVDDPQKFGWVVPQMQEHMGNFLTHFKTPRVGITRLTDEMFAYLWMDQEWSRDAIIACFPLDLRSITDFEEWRKRLGLPKRNAIHIPIEEAMNIFRDNTQFHIPINRLVRMYKYYSRDAVQKQLRSIEINILKTYADNHVLGVEPKKASYAKYRLRSEWMNKKIVMVAPDGPYDLCWECHRPICVATVHLHHMTYQRLGCESWTDLRPLCEECHRYYHPKENKLPEGAVNPNQWVVIENVKTTRMHTSGKSFYCTINGVERNIPYQFINKDTSEVKDFGDEGTLVIKRELALQRGISV